MRLAISCVVKRLHTDEGPPFTIHKVDLHRPRRSAQQDTKDYFIEIHHCNISLLPVRCEIFNREIDIIGVPRFLTSPPRFRFVVSGIIDKLFFCAFQGVNSHQELASMPASRPFGRSVAARNTVGIDYCLLEVGKEA